MNIPEVVRIGSCYYDVEFTNEVMTLNKVEVSGIIDYNNHVIQLRSSIGDVQQQEQTFLHEVVHGIVRDRSLDLGENEEMIVDEISKGLHQVILDNPRMFITEKEIEFEGEGEEEWVYQEQE